MTDPKVLTLFYVAGFNAALQEVDAIVGECVPRGQYESFDERHLHSELQKLREKVSFNEN